VRILRFVLLLSRTGKYGGPADTALAQARLAAAEGHQVVVLGGFVEGDQLVAPTVENLRVRSVKVRPLSKRLFFPSLFSMSAVRAILEEVRVADIVHVSLSRELLSLVAGWISVVARTPVIVQPHGMLTARSSRGGRLIDRVVAPLMKFASRSISLTTIEQGALMRLYDQESTRMRVIGNPVVVDIRKPWQEVEYETSAVFIARLHERKKLVDFVRAAEMAASMGWTDRYHFAGPDQGELSKVQIVLDTLPSLTYAGALAPEQIPEVLGKARTFVMCSAQEPWGNVLIMALTQGVPCIVSRSTALAEEIESAGAGIIVDDGDPEQIARAVHEVNSSPELWGQLRKGALALAADRFSNEKVSKMLLDVYAEALSEK
jgi:glycosyltransferase involved in cell wall biosynthesis